MARDQLLHALSTSFPPELIDHGHTLEARASFPLLGDPSLNAQYCLAEVYRTLVATGASPISIVYGSGDTAAEDEGVASAAEFLGLECRTESGFEHPWIRVTASLDDPTRHIPMGLSDDGDLIYLLGETQEKTSAIDLSREKLIGQIMIAASRDGLLNAAHAVSRGGFGVALAQMAIIGEKGARFWTPDGIDRDEALLSDSPGRIICIVPRTEELRFSDMCIARFVPLQRVGVVDGDALELQSEFTISLDELTAASS